MKISWKTKPSNAERVQSLISQTHNVDRKGLFGFPRSLPVNRCRVSNSPWDVCNSDGRRSRPKEPSGISNLCSCFVFLSITCHACHWKKGFFYASQINFRGCWLVKMQDLLEWQYWNACQWGQDFWMSSFHTSYFSSAMNPHSALRAKLCWQMKWNNLFGRNEDFKK